MRKVALLLLLLPAICCLRSEALASGPAPIAVAERLSPALGATANLLSNGGFEAGTAPWAPTGGAFSTVSTPVHGGSRAAELSCDHGCWLSQFVQVSGSTPHTLSAWTVKNDPTIGYVQATLEWRDAAFVLISKSVSPKLTSDSPGYRLLTTGQATSPAAARWATVRLESAGGSAGNAAVYFDDAVLEAASAPTASATSTGTPTPTSSPTPSPTTQPPASVTPTATRTHTPDSTLTPTATVAGPVIAVINEILYRPHPLETPVTPEARREWIEIYNASDDPIDLAGWTIDDGEERDVLPQLIVPAQGFAVLTGAASYFLSDYPLFSGSLAEVADGSLGNGLANTGDSLTLRDVSGRVVDALSYGDDLTVFDPSCPGVSVGHSLEREPTGYDTDRADDFAEQERPSPGEASFHEPTGTATATPTDAPTATPSATDTATLTPTSTAVNHGCRLPVIVKG